MDKIKKELEELLEETKSIQAKFEELQKRTEEYIEGRLVEDLPKPEVSLLRKLLNEFLRVSPLLALIVPFLFLDDSYKFVLFIAATLSFILLLAHIVRKAMYPYLDIEELVNRAKESPIGASIVLGGFFFFLSIIILTFAILLTK